MLGRRLAGTLLVGIGLGLAFATMRTRTTPPSGLPPGGKRPRVVVLGAGFAGLAAAEELIRGFADGQSGEVVLVDRNNYHLFTPLLYQVAAGALEPDTIAYPVREGFAGRGVEFRESEVEAIDLEGRRVITDTGVVEYDHLIVALGSTTNYFGREDLERNTRPLKTLRDGVVLRNQILAAFEGAEIEEDPERRRELLTFVIVGAGGTGTELAASLFDYVHGTLAKNYPHVDVQSEVRIVLAEGRDEILPWIDRQLARVALAHMRRRGIEVRLGTRVVDVVPGELRTDSGEVIRTRTVVWSAGIKAPRVVAELPVPRGSDGRIQVDENLAVPGYPNVYVVGDAAREVDEVTGQLLPPNGPVAVHSGHVAARNVLRSLRGEKPQPVRYHRVGDLISLADHDAVAEVGPLKISGLPAWLLFRSFYLWRLMGMRNRIGLAMAWLLSYFFRRPAVQFEC